MRKFKSLTIEYCGMFSFEPFAAMVHFAEINPIVKEIAERARCEGNHGACYGSGITKDEFDTHYRDNTGWPVYAGSINTAWLDSSQFDVIPVGSQGLIHTNWVVEMVLDAIDQSRNIGDRNIYGDFTATRVDNDHFLWNDTYNFDIKPAYSPSGIARDAATYWGGFVAGQGQGGKGFDIIGIKPALIPGR